MSLILNGTDGVQFNDTSLQGAAASPYVLKNRIINGAMVIDQRNAGASVTANDGVFPVDRFFYYAYVNNKGTLQQNAAAVTPPTGFYNYLGFTSSSTYSIGAGEALTICQKIEGFNTADLDFGKATAKTVTISFWIRSSLTGTFGGSIQNSARNRSYPFTYTISVANTWEQKSVTIAGDTSGTWIGATNGVGMYLHFSVGTGTTYSGTASVWGSADYQSATGATSVVGTNGATFYITGIQLEVGSTATPFERRLYNQELANCQRYYYQTDPVKAAPMGRGAVGTSGAARIVWMFPTTMRAAPTFAYSGTFDASTGYSSIPLSDTMKSTYATISSTTSAASGTVLFMDGGSTGYLTFSAEL